MARLREPVVKSVGKPDAGNRHVRFDERGRETAGCHSVPVQRPSSTLPAAVTFDNPNQAATAARFTTSGTHGLQLSASGGAHTTNSTVTITLMGNPTSSLTLL